MNWLKGKKTYISAVGLVLLGVALVTRGADGIGMYCILTGAGLVGLGDRANRHRAEILQAIFEMDALAGVPSAANHDQLAAAELTKAATSGKAR